LEQAVIEAATTLRTDHRTVVALPLIDAQSTRRRIDAAQALGSAMRSGRKSEVRQTLQSFDLAMVVHPDGIDASISRRRLVALLEGTAPVADDDGVRMPLIINTAPDQRGRNLKLVLRTGAVRRGAFFMVLGRKVRLSVTRFVTASAKWRGTSPFWRPRQDQAQKASQSENAWCTRRDSNPRPSD
jgi:hypothetical protein